MVVSLAKVDSLKLLILVWEVEYQSIANSCDRSYEPINNLIFYLHDK